VFRYTDARVPVWPINSTLASFGSDVQGEPTVQIELTMAADTQGMGFLTNARAGDTRYIRLAATSTELAGNTAAVYDLLISMAGKISSISAFDDQDGVKVITYTFDAVYDSAWGSGQFMTVQYTNKTASL
jgi:hypothetical protein